MKPSILLIAAIFILFIGCKSVARYPMSAPSAENLDDRLIGIWKFREDTNSGNYYEVTKRAAEGNSYHLRFFDRGGTNPSYESNLFVTRIGNTTFINIGYFEEDFKNEGYIFLKVLNATTDYSRVTTATVNDPTIGQLKSKEEVQERIAENIHRASFFNDTVHLYKVVQ